jgi:hypothetical protein
MIRHNAYVVVKSIEPLPLGHISKQGVTQKRFVAAVRLAVTAAVPVLLSGCLGATMSGFSSTDPKLTTSAVQTNYQAPADSVSDEMTVRNAVSSADLSQPGPVSIPWANTSTGSAGVVNSITEENNGSYVCRIFNTTRHSYRGISNFRGKACLVGSGEWQMISFQEIG